MKIELRKGLLHPVSLVGEVLASFGFLASTVLLLHDLFVGESDPYRGIFAYLFFPPLMFSGLFLILAGLYLNRRRARRLEGANLPYSPALDLKRTGHRRALILGGGFVLLFIVASLVGGMHAYEFTESVTFCGETCHTPMTPQYVAYQDSPHAKVACAECHVGPGVDHYVSAKLAGMRQVFKVFTNTFDRPIHAGLDKLRRSADTCEHCHWREKFWGTRLDQRVRFGYDVVSSPRPVQMLLKVGGGGNAGTQSGIHWHMNLANRVLYRALDANQQDIPWVEVDRQDGTRVIYRDEKRPLTPEELGHLPVHTMDCLSCHNRPAHRFGTPDHAVDLALSAGRLDRSLPFIKKLSVEALTTSYPDPASARTGIREHLTGFYGRQFQGKVLERKASLEQAESELAAIYARNVFPEMKIDGYTHPDNIGHREFPGCFRCHSGRHKREDGTPLDSSCDLCHTFARSDPATATLTEIPADASTVHPWRQSDKHPRECWTCHTGKSTPYGSCAGCHKDAGEEHPMSFECSTCHKPASPALTSGSCGPCHPAGQSALHAKAGHADCLGCHKPHGWKAKAGENCFPCHEKIRESHYPGKACGPCHDFRGALSTMKGLPVSTG